MASVKLILTLGLILSVSSVFGRRSHRRRFEDSRESSDGLQFNGQTNAEDYLPTDPEQVPQEDTGKVNYLAITDFTLQLTKQLMRTENNNLVVSPVSISTLLAMLAQGARPLSPTQQELEGVLNLNKRSAQLTYKSFGKDLRRSSGNDVIFENAIFTKEALSTERLATNFNAAVETVSFSNPPQAARTINNWVETKTHGKISNLITPDAIDHSTQCVLVNAIFFKNQWVAKFDESKTKVQEFAVTERERINVPFMNLFGDFPAGKDDAIGAVWLKLAFANSEYSMVFILPKVQNRLDNLIEGLTTDDLHKMLSSTQKRPVSVHIPRFKFEYNTQLNSALKAMGLTHIFEDNNRDLKIGNTPVRVSNALQKAVISVDEKGASAAAASALVVNTLSLNSYSNNINFMANHPFLAVLVNKKSIPIFVAKVSNPLLSN